MSKNPDLQKQHLVNIFCLSIWNFVAGGMGLFAAGEASRSSTEASIGNIVVYAFWIGTLISLVYMSFNFFTNAEFTNEQARKISLIPFWLFLSLLVLGPFTSLILNITKEN